MDQREIWIPSSQLNFEHSHCWKFRNNIGGERNVLRILASPFSQRPKIYPSKTTITYSLTVGSLWNFDTRFEIHLLTSSLLDFQINLWKGRNMHCTQTVEWRLQSLLLLSNAWKPHQSNQRKCLRNHMKLLEIPLSLSEYTLELEWTCVRILRELDCGSFWDVYWIIIFPLWL